MRGVWLGFGSESGPKKPTKPFGVGGRVVYFLKEHGPR